MDEALFLGYLVLAVITLGAFTLVIQRFTQPVNDLKIAIQELRDYIGTLRESNAVQNKRIEELEKTVSRMDAALGKIQTMIQLYHGNK